MTDPEILDPEGRRPDGRKSAKDPIEALVDDVQRALPGRTVRVQVEALAGRAAGPGGILALGGPRVRIECEGKGGTLLVESGPFFALTVSFAGARFPFDISRMGPGVDVVRAKIVEKVKEIASDAIVVLDEQPTGGLARYTVLGADAGRLERVLDSGLMPRTAPPAGARLCSFLGTFDGPPTGQVMAQIDRLRGGTFGKVKRAVAEKVFAKAASTLARGLDTAAERQAAAARDAEPVPGEARPDPGTQKLGR